MTSILNFWDQRFAEPGYKYGLEPNAFLRDQASRLHPASDGPKDAHMLYTPEQLSADFDALLSPVLA